ncbi:hypothetical protein BY458DRAFT_438819 [Sporodiniella umbellata]|nr:hypothetical protein BY458DRAFT_438819 [Sporodiniella umbellata]
MLPQFQEGNCEDLWNVLVWCTIPIPFDDCEAYPCDYQQNPYPNHINFWFYLFWYFGVYNAIALFLMTKMFSIYALNWYTGWMGPWMTFSLFWLTSQWIGMGAYFIWPLRNISLFWIGLTFITMSMPLMTSFWIIFKKKRHQKIHHRIATETASSKMQYVRKISEHPKKKKKAGRWPASYKRFLWFCMVLGIALVALVAGEWYAVLFLAVMPHTPLEVFVYVYSWVGAIYVMDGWTDWILYRKIRSHPLSTTQTWYRLTVRFLGLTLTYPEYQQKVARSFYLRHLAENTSMLGFLCWFNLLHFGPNRAAYPYFFLDNKDGNPFNHTKTCLAATLIWTSEYTSSWIARRLLKKHLSLSVTQQAMKEFRQYPEMMVGFVLVMVHVLQNILFALIRLDFE